LRLSLRYHPDGAETASANCVLYDAELEAAVGGPGAVAAGAALSWCLHDGEAPGDVVLSAEVDLDPSVNWLMRCDRVDFGPGGIAYRHTHPGPGIRYLLFGEIAIETEGATRTYGPGEAWFERGPDPVLATTSDREPSAFVRVLLLPAEYAGQRTIRYVDPADADKPKTQKATVFLEQPVQR
jgi:quercetin dioxygenase-like cupin family protein